jgi:hypothetical protein
MSEIFNIHVVKFVEGGQKRQRGIGAPPAPHGEIEAKKAPFPPPFPIESGNGDGGEKARVSMRQSGHAS